jgi:hypothetical protein
MVDVVLKLTRSPKNRASTSDIAPPCPLCPDGYSGTGPISISDIQFGSPIVSGLPSVSPARTAVIGRQNSYKYLFAKSAM